MCEHAKPWVVSVEVEVITENGRNRPGRAQHNFWCRKCGDVLEQKWMDESMMSMGDALRYAGLKSWHEMRYLPIEPEAQAKETARLNERLQQRLSPPAPAQEP